MTIELLGQEKNTLTILQQEELEEAKEDGLSELQIKNLKKWNLNYLQMRVIRMAMKDGVDEHILSKIAKSHVHHNEMKQLIEDYREGEKIKVPMKKYHGTLWVFMGSVIILFVFIYIYHTQSMRNDIYLSLKTNRIEIGCGELFDPKEYIDQYSSDHGQLLLVDTFEANTPGSYVIPYVIKNEKREIKELLYVDVVDKDAPRITLKTRQTTVLKGASFNCLGYVIQAIDDVDGDLSRLVACDNTLTEEENQKVRFSVVDRNGNEGEAFLNIHFIDPLENLTEETEEVLTMQETIAQNTTVQTSNVMQEIVEEVEEYYDAYIFREDTNETNLLAEQDKIIIE